MYNGRHFGIIGDSEEGLSEKKSGCPRHVAIIMDGNGRWAKRLGKLRVSGHKAGAMSAKAIIRHASDCGVAALSLFAFSSENWKRPSTEVNYLMDLFVTMLAKELREMHENQVRLKFSGNMSGLSAKLQAVITDAEALTAANPGLYLNIVLNYGGQDDIVQASKALAVKVAQGEMSADEINADSFAKALLTYPLPEPDLLIRTSGEMRISNFFLWQLAYSELYFCDCHWPDFTTEEFDKALAEFSRRKRRFGCIDETSAEETPC